MIFPDTLRVGDKIGLVAPARKINPSEVEYASKIISSWGLQVVLSKNIYNSQTYLSAPDEQRLEDLQQMMDDASMKAILCARGGYGVTRIVDLLDLSQLKLFPKWIIGFSDITALHLRLVDENIASVHGTMPVLFAKADAGDSIENLKKLLFSGMVDIKVKPSPLNRNGTASGCLIGGNLSLLVESLGTKTELNTSGKILFIEEIDEPIYKIDRMLTQLRRAGKFEMLNGLIVGHMTDITDTEVPFGMNVEEIVLNAVRHYSFPVGFHFPSGHENPNYSWLHGAMTSIEVSSNIFSVKSQIPKRDIQ
jgi:muramoyltetrapeptide carboxypeptidase